MEPILFVGLLALGVYLAFKVVKVLVRLAIVAGLALAFYFLLYPRIASLLQ
jgi:hypothetical protein